MLSVGSAKKIEASDMEVQFPEVEYDFEPFGNRVFVQIRYPIQITKSGLVLSSDTVQDAYRNEQCAKVVGMGASCFMLMTTGAEWPTGRAFEVGEFVRVPLHGGDNHWEIATINGEQQTILFKIFKDHEIIGKYRKPLDVKTNYAYF